MTLDDAVNQGTRTSTVVFRSFDWTASFDTRVFDNDAPPVPTIVTVTGNTVTEGDGQNITFTFKRTGDLFGPLTVNYDFPNDIFLRGDKLSAADFVRGQEAFDAGTVTFKAGSDTALVTLAINDDQVAEINEVMGLRILPGSTYTAVHTEQGYAVAQVLDNDAPHSITVANAPTVNEGGTLEYVVTLDRPATGPLDVFFAAERGPLGGPLGGKITFATGQTTGVISVPTVDNGFYQGDQTVTLQAWTKFDAREPHLTATGTVTDDEQDLASVLFQQIDPATGGVTNANLVVPEGSTLVYRATMDRVRPTDTTVSYRVNGGAWQTTTIAANTDSALISIPVGDDDLYQGTTSRNLRVDFSSPNSVAAFDTTVTDNETRPYLQLHREAETVAEGGVAAFTVDLTGKSSTDTVVGLILTDANGDPTSSVVTIAAGQTSARVEIPVEQDDFYNPNRSVQVQIGAVVSGLAGVDSEFEAVSSNVLDDDAAPTLSLSGPESVNETVGTAKFTVTRSGDTSQAISFNYTENVGGSRRGGTIAAGETTFTFDATFADDAIYNPGRSIEASISDPSLGTITQRTATTAIIDNEGMPTLNITSAGTDEGGNLVFSADLSHASSTPITFRVSTLDGTATVADGDYTALSGQLVTIPANGVSTTFTVQTTGDSKFEADETVGLSISEVSGANLASVGEGTIRNDDSATSTLSISALGDATEGGVMRFGASRANGDLSQAESFTITIGGTASSADFESVTGDVTSGIKPKPRTHTLNFAAGSTTAFIDIATRADNLFEGDETVEVGFTGANGPTSAIATLHDADTQPTIQIGQAQVTEGGELGFLVTLNRASSTPITFKVATDNLFTVPPGFTRAQEGADYTLPTQTFTIPANSTSVMVRVPTTTDDGFEGTNPERLRLTLTDVAGATYTYSQGGLDGRGEIIEGSPEPTLSINGGGDYVEGDPIVFSASRSGTSSAPQTFTFRLGGTTDERDFGRPAITGEGITDLGGGNYSITFQGNEQTKSITVETRADDVYESPETVSLTFTGANGAEGIVTANLNSQDGTPPPTMVYVHEAYGGYEALAAAQGGSYAAQMFTLYLDHPAGPGGIDVVVSTEEVSGTPGEDYEPLDHVTVHIPEGQTSVFVPITVLDDADVEGLEGVLLRINSVSGGLTIEKDLDSSLIFSDDTTPPVSVLSITGSAPTTEGGENDPPGVLSFVARRSGGDNSQAEVFDIRIGGTANMENPRDFSGIPVTGTDQPGVYQIRFEAGETARQLFFFVEKDRVYEGDEPESLIIEYTGANGETLQATGLITDSTPMPVVFINYGDPEVNERGTAQYQIMLDRQSSQPVTVDYQIHFANGTSQADIGAPLTGQVTFEPGRTDATIQIPIVDDARVEQGEGFTFGLSNPVGATLSEEPGKAEVSTAIIDNDVLPTLNVSGASVSEGGELRFRVTATGAFEDPISFRAQTELRLAGLYSAGSDDFTALDQVFTLRPEDVEGIEVAVQTTPDSMFEQSEALNLMLSDITGALGGTTRAVGQIQNDDAQPMVYVTSSQQTVTEGQSIPYEIRLNKVSGVPVTVGWRVDYDGANVVTQTGEVTLAPGETVKAVPIATINDNLYTGVAGRNPAFMSITSASNATVTGSPYYVPVIDNEIRPDFLQISNATTTEGGDLVFTATINTGLDRAHDIGLLVTGQTASGADFTAPASFRFEAGQTTANFVIRATEDTLVETTETLRVEIDRQNSSFQFSSTSIATGTIRDDDSIQREG